MGIVFEVQNSDDFCLFALKGWMSSAKVATQGFEDSKGEDSKEVLSRIIKTALPVTRGYSTFVISSRIP